MLLALEGVLLLPGLPITLYSVLRHFYVVSEDLSLSFERRAFVSFTLALALTMFTMYIIFNVFFLAKIVFMYLVTTAVSLIIDFVDKISIHVLTIFITFIIFAKYISVAVALLIFLVSLIVAWSRIKLKNIL